MNQERPSRPIPGKESMFFKQIGIDLGSRFAAQLGFDGIEAHVEDPNVVEAAAAAGGGKKKKKRRKKKKKGGAGGGGGEGTDGNQEEDEEEDAE
jgi:hypothetical protein